jgi:hypothetical protein
MIDPLPTGSIGTRLTALQLTPSPDVPSTMSFALHSLDGGARQSVPPPPPSHEDTLTAILASRAADPRRIFGA